MLTRLATTTLVASVAAALVVACDSAPPSAAPDQAAPTIAARWAADDGSIVAINLVVPAGTDSSRIRQLAEAERAAHRRARVLVRVFASTAGAERFVVGHVPAPGEPLPVESRPPGLIALYDFPP